MRTLFRPLLALNLLVLPFHLHAADADSGQVPGVKVAAMDIEPALKAEMLQQGKASSLNRVVEALNAHLGSDFTATGRFQMLESTARLGKIIEEQQFNNSGNVKAGSGGQASQLIGASYLIQTRITAFQDNMAQLKAPTRDLVKHRRTIEVSGTVDITDVGTGEKLVAVNPKTRIVKVWDIPAEMKIPVTESDVVLDLAVRDFSRRVMNGVIDRLNPYVVLSAHDKTITIDAGDTTGIEKGQVWEFLATEEKIHPRTKKKYRDERYVGVGAVTAVRGDRAVLQATENLGIPEGAVARLKEDAPAAATEK